MYSTFKWTVSRQIMSILNLNEVFPAKYEYSTFKCNVFPPNMQCHGYGHIQSNGGVTEV